MIRDPADHLEHVPGPVEDPGRRRIRRAIILLSLAVVIVAGVLLGTWRVARPPAPKPSPTTTSTATVPTTAAPPVVVIVPGAPDVIVNPPAATTGTPGPGPTTPSSPPPPNPQPSPTAAPTTTSTAPAPTLLPPITVPRLLRPDATRADRGPAGGPWAALCALGAIGLAVGCRR